MTDLEIFSEYTENKRAALLKDYPDCKELTDNFIGRIKEFTAEDFEGVSENKVFRIFLETVIDMVNQSFENKASKSYLRSFWKIFDTEDAHKSLTAFMKSKKGSVKCITSRLVNFYVYMNTSSSEKYRRREIMGFLNNMM